MNNEKMLPFRCHRGHQTLENPVISGFLGALKLFPLDKFKYMEVYLLCFHGKNFRKYVNISPLIFGCPFS